MSKTETRPSQNAFDSEMRPRPSKNVFETGLKTKNDLEYYNATQTEQLSRVLQCFYTLFNMNGSEWGLKMQSDNICKRTVIFANVEKPKYKLVWSFKDHNCKAEYVQWVGVLKLFLYIGEVM